MDGEDLKLIGELDPPLSTEWGCLGPARTGLLSKQRSAVLLLLRGESVKTKAAF